MKKHQFVFLVTSVCIILVMTSFLYRQAQPDTRKIVPAAAPNPWGVTFEAADVMRGGLTIICTQSGGDVTGELSTGAPFWLEEKTPEGWRQMETKQKELVWTAEAWGIPMEDTVEWEVRWANLYGSLKKGTYRIGKSVMDWRSPGVYDLCSVYAEFVIG